VALGGGAASGVALGGGAASGVALGGGAASGVALGVALAAAAADFWAAASLMPEACLWAGKALARIGDAAGTRFEMILQCSLGITLTLTRGMNDDARGALRRALTLAREFADFDYQQRVTSHLWMFLVRASALNDALAMARQFEEVAGFGDTQSRLVVDFWVGIAQVYRAAHVEATERLRRVIDHYPIESRGRDTIRFAGDFHAGVSGHIAVSLLSRGLLDTASRSAASAAEKARGTNSAVQLCVALAWAAGFIFVSLSELETAERYGDELINHATRHALRPFVAVGLCVRGSVAVQRADLDAGVDLLRRGLTEMRDASYQLFYPFFLVRLAAALGAPGRVDEGLAEIDWVLRFAAETGHRWVVPEALRVKGQLFALRDLDDPAVEDCFDRGTEVAREQDALFWELRLALSLARLRVTQGRPGAAKALLASVYDRFTEGFATADLRAARTMLERLPT
jgi:non-specific serine/threonine protein kinase